MYYVNPQQLVAQIKSGMNPQQLMLNILQTQMGHTPIGQNLLTLARNGQTAEIEKIVRNLAAQEGRDFDSEFNMFKQTLGLR